LLPLPRLPITTDNGRFLDEALTSVFDQGVPVEVMLADGGSTDETLKVIRRWEGKLAWCRSSQDAGQSSAINEAIARGKAPYVCWLNADDTFLPSGLRAMVAAPEAHPDAPATYAKCWTTNAASKRLMPYITHPFSARMLANRCFIAQPATLIRRTAWEKVGGVDESLHFAFDYDL
jgi:glycosyltransferase involved in cell wall biosynthesis